ncbi:MAG: HNH endonuclease, partial [Ilumatobacteraceae bacterium]
GDETARHLCQLASGTVIPPEDLAEHLDHAVMQAFLFDGTNTVVATSSKRTFTGALRRAVLVRDKRCTHPSVCPTPAGECDVDHRRPAARGGPTNQFNGAAECPTHNRHPDLHGHPEPMPERALTMLDQFRVKARWAVRRLDTEPDDLPRHGPF